MNKTCASSFVCTFPVTAPCLKGLLDLLRKVSLWSEHKSLLLSIVFFFCQIPRYFAVTICLSSKPGAEGFRTWGSPFWIMPPDCPFLSQILSRTRCILRISWCVPPKRSISFSSFPQKRIHWIWVLRYTTLDLVSSQNSNCSLSTFFSRPRAEVTSHHQHVEIGNDGHKCICFQTCNHDTRDGADNYMTIFFILSTTDKDFLTPVAGLALRLFEFFHVSLFVHFWYWRGYSLLVRSSLRLPLLSTQSHGVPGHACEENYNCIFLNKTQFSNFQISPRKICPFPSVASLCANYYSEIHDPAPKFCLVMESVQMHLRRETTRNCHALNTSPNTHGTVVLNKGHFPPFRLFVLLLPKNKVKVFTAVILRFHFSQFLLFSEYPTMLQKIHELLCNSSGSRRACWQSKTLFPFRGQAFWNSTSAWCEALALPKLLGESGSWKTLESSRNSNRSCNFRIWSPNKLTVRDS